VTGVVVVSHGGLLRSLEQLGGLKEDKIYVRLLCAG
jgi:hypothetical protein